jgi:hypothetical protein
LASGRKRGKGGRTGGGQTAEVPIAQRPRRRTPSRSHAGIGVVFCSYRGRVFLVGGVCCAFTSARIGLADRASGRWHEASHHERLNDDQLLFVTDRELEFLIALRTSWRRLYVSEVARLLNENDVNCRRWQSEAGESAESSERARTWRRLGGPS